MSETKKFHPYTDLKQRFQAVLDRFNNRKREKFFFYSKANVQSSVDVRDNWARVNTAAQLGYETHVTAESDGSLRYTFVEKIAIPNYA